MLSARTVGIQFSQPEVAPSPAAYLRSYMGLVELARYRVPTSLDLETRTECETVVWRLLPGMNGSEGVA